MEAEYTYHFGLHITDEHCFWRKSKVRNEESMMCSHPLMGVLEVIEECSIVF